MIKAFLHGIKLFSDSGKEFYSFIRVTLGIYPKNIALYKLAFVHKSITKIDSRGVLINNERLEYLGDAVLGAVIADYLYNRFPNKDEGFLTQMRSKLVNRSFLTKLAFQMGLDQYVESTSNNKNEQSHIYGDALEALIGALYLDKGYKTTRKAVIKNIFSKYVDINQVELSNTNYKSKLIEWGQKNKKEIDFETLEGVRESGEYPFMAIAFVDNKKVGKGKGYSKKEAQQNAAKETIRQLSI